MSDPVRVRPFVITQTFPGLDMNGMLQTLSRYMLLQQVRGEPYAISSFGGRTVRTKVTGHWLLLSQLPDRCFQAMKSNIGLILKVALKLVEEVAVLHSHGIMHGNIRPETILLLLERDDEPCPALGLVDLSHGDRATRAKDLQDVARCLAWLVARSHMGGFVADRERSGFDTMEAFELARGSMCARPFVTSTHTAILNMIKALAGSGKAEMGASTADQHPRAKPLLTQQQSLVARILCKISMSDPSHFNIQFIHALLHIFIPAVLMMQAGVADSYEEEVADFMLLLGAPLLSSCGAKVDSSSMVCEFNHIGHGVLARVAEEAKVMAEMARSEPLAVLATICDPTTFLNFAAIFHYCSR